MRHVTNIRRIHPHEARHERQRQEHDRNDSKRVDSGLLAVLVRVDHLEAGQAQRLGILAHAGEAADLGVDGGGAVVDDVGRDGVGSGEKSAPGVLLALLERQAEVGEHGELLVQDVGDGFELLLEGVDALLVGAVERVFVHAVFLGLLLGWLCLEWRSRGGGMGSGSAGFDVPVGSSSHDTR